MSTEMRKYRLNRYKQEGFWKKYISRKTVLILIGLIIISGFIFPIFVKSTVVWDGAFPTAEYRLLLVDQEGNPVSGVTLKRADKLQKKYGDVVLTQPWSQAERKNKPIGDIGYPFKEVSRTDHPTSGENGQIIVHHISRGLEFGGTCYEQSYGIFEYFWSDRTDIECGGAPSFRFVLTKDGEVLKRFEYPDIFREEHKELSRKTRRTIEYRTEQGEKQEIIFPIVEEKIVVTNKH